jgi:site-specific DNA recombinase
LSARHSSFTPLAPIPSILSLKSFIIEGCEPDPGKQIPRPSLSDLLNNSFYIGVIEVRRTGQVFQGIHKPLVSKALFDRVQAVLDGRAAHHGLRHTFLFQRLLRCQHCGYRLSAERQKGHTYYRCQKKDCPTTCLREDAVEHAVIASLRALSLDEEECESLRISALALRAEWATRSEEERNSVELNLRKADARFDRLTDAFLDGALDRETFENRKRALILERTELRERSEYLASNDQSLPSKLANFLELAKTASLSYQSGNLYEKRDLVKSVTSNLEVDRNNVVIKLRKPFEALANRQKNSDGGPYRNEPRTFLRKIFWVFWPIATR